MKFTDYLKENLNESSSVMCTNDEEFISISKYEDLSLSDQLQTMFNFAVASANNIESMIPLTYEGELPPKYTFLKDLKNAVESFNREILGKIQSDLALLKKDSVQVNIYGVTDKTENNVKSLLKKYKIKANDNYIFKTSILNALSITKEIQENNGFENVEIDYKS